MTDLEHAANDIELAGGAAEWADSLRRVDLERRIALERADAERGIVAHAVKRIEGHTVRGESYRKAMKLAVRLIRDVLMERQTTR